MLKFVTHPDKPGVRAPMRNQETLDLHLAGGWELEEEGQEVETEVDITPEQITPAEPKKKESRKKKRKSGR